MCVNERTRGTKFMTKESKFNAIDSRIVSELIANEKTPKQFEILDREAYRMTDSCYWFCLSTLWVASSEIAGLEDWKRLFSVKRPNKAISLMKPDELKALAKLPNKIEVFRAHREGETDWIAYSTNPRIAINFANRYGVSEITVGRVKKHDVTALFLRRGEQEVIVLDKSLVKKVTTIQLMEVQTNETQSK